MGVYREIFIMKGKEMCRNHNIHSRHSTEQHKAKIKKSCVCLPENIVLWQLLIRRFPHVFMSLLLLYIHEQSNLDNSKLMWLFFTIPNYPKCKLICTSGNLDLLKSPQGQIMVGESHKNVFLIQIYASSFAEFEISEFEISRLGCM